MSKKHPNYILTFLFVVWSIPAFAEKGGMPSYVGYGLFVGGIILGLAVSRFIALMLKHVLEGLKKETRKHGWFMTIGTFIFPASFLYVEDKYQVLYYIKYANYWVIFLVLLIIGFLIGYFITPKKAPIKLY